MRPFNHAIGAALLAAVLVAPPLFAQTKGGKGAALEGRWGGDRLQLVLNASGGRVQMDCASGTIAGPLKPDAAGGFAATGTFEQHRPGPQRADDAQAAAKARYTGEVKDSAMTLTIEAEGAAAPQVFHLRRGEAVKMVRCL